MKLEFSDAYIKMQKTPLCYNVPTIFLEVPKCNLLCKRICNDKCVKYCDFTDKIPECGKLGFISTEFVKKLIEDHKVVKHIFIYGGEPLLYKEELEKFLNDIWRDDMHITIQTNGTLPILNPLSFRYRIERYIVNLAEKETPMAGDIFADRDGTITVLGTKDVQKLEPVRIHNLKNLCMYSADYLLCFGTRNLKNLNKYTENVLRQIELDNDEFVKSFLEKHSVRNKIAFTPTSEGQVNSLYKMCIDKGVPFYDTRCYRYPR